MNDMNMGQMDAYMAPLWLIYGLSAAFFAGALFYLYRLLRPATVRKAYGYYDWQNEIGHGICMLAMAFAMAPPAVQLPSQFWAATLMTFGLFFLARAVTWGRRLPYNKWWWDWAHCGMLLGMALMFLPINVGYFSYVLDAFWLWFAGYYVYSLCHDLQEPDKLYIGSDLSHLAMGAVMFIMTVAPMALMAPGTSMSGMPGMICSSSVHTAQPHAGSAVSKPASSPMSDMADMPDMPHMNGMKMNHPSASTPGGDDMNSMPGMDMSGHDQPSVQPSAQVGKNQPKVQPKP
jgi:hypothetical protein